MSSIHTLEKWIDSYLNFEKTPKKNIFWLDTLKFFCEKFGHPENFAPCFHVAGSKGKGSISKFIASILDEAGFKTGLYTSPHILDFIERVSSASGAFEENVYAASAKELMEGVQSIKAEELPMERPITWFELVTLFSFLVFRNAKVDYSVFEVGLGGRLDSTNVVDSVCACIGPIELEHTEFLGDTLEKIAAEKGGIIKENKPVIIAMQEPCVRAVFEKIAEEKHAEAIFIEDISELRQTTYIFEDTTFKMQIKFSSKEFKRPIKAKLKMLGRFQAENAILASIAVKKAIPKITEEQIEKGLAKTLLPARFEFITPPPQYKNIHSLILDGAHTVKSVTFTMETLNHIFEKEEKKRVLLFACAADKDAKDIAPLFKDSFDFVFLTKPGNTKQSDVPALTRAFDAAAVPYNANEDFEFQIQTALKKAHDEKAILLVTGSFYLAAEVKRIMEK